MQIATIARQELDHAVRSAIAELAPIPDLEEPASQLGHLGHARATVERAIALVVGQARRDDVGWSMIGQALGVSKQAAQQRYGSLGVDATIVEGADGNWTVAFYDGMCNQTFELPFRPTHDDVVAVVNAGREIEMLWQSGAASEDPTVAEEAVAAEAAVRAAILERGPADAGPR